MKFDIITISVYVLVIFIAFNMIISKPQYYGDGREYHLMLQSFSNHLSPDLQKQDIEDIYGDNSKYIVNETISFPGYFKSKNGKLYCYHFFFYPLICLPTKLVLDFFHRNPLLAFQITNMLLFIAMIFGIFYLMKFSKKQKFFLILLLVTSPAIFFIHWTHPEIFSLVFVVFSLIFMENKKFLLSILFASTASFQNQPLVFFVLFLFVYGLIKSKSKFRDFFKYGFLSCLIFMPNLFYFIYFGKFSLLYSSINNISLFRVYELFFDLNIGMFPYIPVTLLIFFGIVVYKLCNNLFCKRKFTLEIGIFLLLIFMMLVCSSIPNWNSGTSGPSRYVIWMLPFIFYVIVRNLELIYKYNLLKYILIIAIIIQFLIVLNGGLLFPHYGDYVYHSYLAKFVLNNFPVIYNPTPEIFCERTLNKEVKCNNPTIYYSNKKCKKALLKCNGLTTLKSKCNNVSENVMNFCNNNSKNNIWFYINY